VGNIQRRSIIFLQIIIKSVQVGFVQYWKLEDSLIKMTMGLLHRWNWSQN